MLSRQSGFDLFTVDSQLRFDLSRVAFPDTRS